MLLAAKLSFLESFLGPYHIQTNGKEKSEYIFYCPFCHHYKKKFSINLQKGLAHCWVCNTAGSIDYIIKKTNNLDIISKWNELSNHLSIDNIDLRNLVTGSLERMYKKEVEEIKYNNVRLPHEYYSLINNFSSASISVRNYLYDRDVKEDDIIKWRIGYAIGGEYDKRLIIPSFDIEGNLNYFLTRTYYNEKPVYKNPPISKDIIFNEINIDFCKPIIICEGIFDAMVCGDNSIPILGSSLKENSLLVKKIIENKTIVYLVLDPDAFYKEMKISKMLIGMGIQVFKVDVKPFKDVGEMSRNEFQVRKEKAIYLNDFFSSYYIESKLMEIK